MREDQVPSGQRPAAHGGEMIVATGPTTVEPGGYYCDTRACDAPVRAAAPVYRDRRVGVYALVSRHRGPASL